MAKLVQPMCAQVIPIIHECIIISFLSNANLEFANLGSRIK